MNKERTKFTISTHSLMAQIHWRRDRDQQISERNKNRSNFDNEIENAVKPSAYPPIIHSGYNRGMRNGLQNV